MSNSGRFDLFYYCGNETVFSYMNYCNCACQMPEAKTDFYLHNQNGYQVDKTNTQI